MASEALFQKIFSTIDKDGDGSISDAEVDTYFKALGLKCSDEAVKALVKLYDTDGDGTIDKTEFVNVTKKTSAALVSKEAKVTEMFQKLFGGEGSVTADRLEAIFKVHGYSSTAEERTEMLKQADADGNGDVTFEEFVLKMAELILKH